MHDIISGCACFVCVVMEIRYEVILPIYVLRIYCYAYRYAYVLLRNQLSTCNTQHAVWFSWLFVFLL